MKLIAAHVQFSKNNQYLKQSRIDTLRFQEASTSKKASATKNNLSQLKTHLVKAKRPHHAPLQPQSAQEANPQHLNALKLPCRVKVLSTQK